MAASSVGETVVAPSNGDDSNASGQLPLKKTPSRPTAVSSVYELLTRPPAIYNSSSSSSSKMMLLPNGNGCSATTTTITAIKSANNNNNNNATSTAYQYRQSFDSSNGNTATSSTLMTIKTIAATHQNGNNNGSSNGHHHHHHHHNGHNGHNGNAHQNSSSSSPSFLTTPPNGTTSSSYSPSSASSSCSSSSNGHSPSQTMFGSSTPPVPPKRHSIPYYREIVEATRNAREININNDNNGSNDDRLLMVEKRSSYTTSTTHTMATRFTMDSPEEESTSEDNGEDYPAEFVTFTNASSARRASSRGSLMSNFASSLLAGGSESNGLGSGYLSNGHSPALTRRRSSCLCSSLGLQCRDNPSGFTPSPSVKPAAPPRVVAAAARTTSGGAAESSTGAPATRSASSIKDQLLKWTQQATAGYENVKVTNFSSSWSDGMAFCAIVHHYYPNAFDFGKLDPKRRKANFKLAFDLAEKLGDVPQLLEVEDMVRMKQPDWKCVFTYVQTMYRKLHDKQPTYLPPRKSSGSGEAETCGTSTSSTSGVESVSSADSPSKLSPMPAHDDDESPSNPFKEEFAKLNVSSH